MATRCPFGEDGQQGHIHSHRRRLQNWESRAHYALKWEHCALKVSQKLFQRDTLQQEQPFYA